MIHLAIDHGKKFSHAIALTDDGEICFDEQIPTTYEGLASIKEALTAGEPVHSTIEAGWNHLWTDTPNTLDYERMRDVKEGLLNVLQNAD